MDVATIAVSEKEIRRVVSMFYDRTWKNKHRMSDVLPFVFNWLKNEEEIESEIIIQSSPETRFRHLAFAIAMCLADFAVDDMAPLEPDPLDSHNCDL